MLNASFRPVTPVGLVINSMTTDQDKVLVAAHPVAVIATCPDCSMISTQVHSHYQRRLLDLPIAGRSVHLRVQVPRFRCPNHSCNRVVFGKKLADDVAPRAARRTSRLEGIVHHIGIALGGRPAATLARRLMLPISRDTLLRVVRRRAAPVCCLAKRRRRGNSLSC